MGLMKLSEYIAGLTKFMAENGDMEAFYAADDEGNAYQGCSHAGSLYHIQEHQKDEWRPELIGDDPEYLQEIKDYGGTLIQVCVVN
jgi:hypothetical protein